MRGCHAYFIVILLSFFVISCTNSARNEVKDLIATMSLEQKVGQMFMIRPESLLPDSLSSRPASELTAEMMSDYKSYPAGGFLFYAGNIKDSIQLVRFTTALHALPLNPVIAIDEEGGCTARIAGKRKFKVPLFYSMCYNSEEVVSECSYQIGKYLKRFGFDIDFAPVADVNSRSYPQSCTDRSFGEDSRDVSKKVGLYLDGLQKAGIAGCVKHFPGLGKTSNDTHLGEAICNENWDELSKCDIIPFKTGIKKDVDFIMLSHASYPGITGNKLPATINADIINKLRKKLNYDGIIITDALNMAAVTNYYSQEEIAVKAVNAGVDILLAPDEYRKMFNAVLYAIRNGEIQESRIDESVNRILKFKYER